ncbi:MAG: DUF397 domain-containing protein [Pseudonocardia sp.]
MRDDHTPAVWRKSTFSNNTGACVEVADLPGGGRGVRDSKNPTGPALMFTAAEWVAFVAGVRDGEFD